MVVIGVENKGKGKPLGRIRLQRVADASGNSLIDFVTKNIEPGSTVRTDGWRGYNGLKAAGYKHVLAKDEADVAKDDENMLPLAHRVASLLKRWLLGTYQGAVQQTHIDYYLDEYRGAAGVALAERELIFFRSRASLVCVERLRLRFAIVPRNRRLHRTS